MRIKVIAGIIFTVFLASILMGCFEADCPDPSENKPILIGCILRNPGKYLNETVIIKGTYELTTQNEPWISTPSIRFGNVPDSLDILSSEEVNTSQLILEDQYIFTGIVKKFEKIHEGRHAYYLYVTNIEEV